MKPETKLCLTLDAICFTCLAPTVVATAGCAGATLLDASDLRPYLETCEVLVTAPEPIGEMRLWVPEAIMSNTGACACYPRGSIWGRRGQTWHQRVEPAGNFGPGNVHRVDADTLECVGIRFPQDSPVAWETMLRPVADGVVFTIRLNNVGPNTIEKAGAAICVKFLQGRWWSDSRVFVLCGGQVRPLNRLGPYAGPDNGFEAWLLEGRSFDNVFYRQFWGFNEHRLDAPVMVSEHTDTGLCVGVEADSAYFLHSNRGNPCTDVMLAFGDLAPQATSQASGRVWFRHGRARELLAGFRR